MCMKDVERGEEDVLKTQGNLPFLSPGKASFPFIKRNWLSAWERNITEHLIIMAPSECFNQVRAGESLMKLVSDLKQFLILNDFPSVNEAINQRNQQLHSLQEDCDKKLIALRDEISIDLYELEEEYYSSRYK